MVETNNEQLVIIEHKPKATGIDTIRALNTLRNLRLWRQWQEERQRRERLADDVREAVEDAYKP